MLQDMESQNEKVSEWSVTQRQELEGLMSWCFPPLPAVDPQTHDAAIKQLLLKAPYNLRGTGLFQTASLEPFRSLSLSLSKKPEEHS